MPFAHKMFHIYYAEIAVYHHGLIILFLVAVRMLSAASPVPLSKHMYAELPTGKPIALVTQPRARSVVLELAKK